MSVAYPSRSMDAGTPTVSPSPMKPILAALALTLVTFAAVPASAQPVQDLERPSSGVGMLVGGGVLTGLGGLNLLTSPICLTDVIRDRDTQKACLGASLVLGGVLLAIGVPLLVVGSSRRRTYQEWKRQHGALAKLADLAVAPQPGGAALTWKLAF